MKTLLLAALLLGSPSHATPVTWEVDALLQSGGQMLGSFEFDADSVACSDIDIVAQSPIVGSHTFTRNPYECGAGWLTLVESPYSTSFRWDGTRIIGGYFGSADDAAGVRVMSGMMSAHAAPEPSSAWLVGLALLTAWLSIKVVRPRRS